MDRTQLMWLGQLLAVGLAFQACMVFGQSDDIQAVDVGQSCSSSAECCAGDNGWLATYAVCPMTCDENCIGPPCGHDDDCDVDWLADGLICNSDKVCAVSNQWLIGMGIFVVGVVFNNVGMQGQKVAFNKEDDRVLALRKEGENIEANPAFMLPIWWAGLITMGSGALMQLLALSFAAQSLLGPLAALTLIFNMMMAPFILNEIPSWKDVALTLFITCGCGVSVLGGDQTAKTFTLDDMMARFEDPVFLIYIIFAALVYGTVITLAIMGRQREWDSIVTETEEPAKKVKRSASIAMLGGLAIERLNMSSDGEDDHHHTRIADVSNAADHAHDVRNTAAFGYGEVHMDTEHEYKPLFVVFRAYVAGQSGGNTMLFSKMFLECVKSYGAEAFGKFQTFWFMALVGLSLYSQMFFLNTALQMYDALFVIPLYMAAFISFSTVNGLLFFKEYEGFDAVGWIMFTLGLVMTVGGVVGLALLYDPSQEDETEGDEESDSDARKKPERIGDDSVVM